ncbi:TraB/GumN family protein [Panacibacter ginsenosidivorans]|uniref:TraB/GumN family protein n=1 Tax=Panacibacter ginsenosidivorans TaxID=1813871 RepID=A0A5B8V5N6_9BACT|nr:TraB/GumN family protein [Panacibacter ginsenosidivorans]QEC66710.1 TraB/GumN family protein [Panacibacter ginsenosidivorans]
MKMKIVFVLLSISVVLFANPFKSFSQKKNTDSKSNTAAANQKKYPSLLWEITGNGLVKPSYLFGTMHISNKMVFNLSDSFYKAIKSVDVVALEQNPEVWQEAYSREDFNGGNDFIHSQLFRSFNMSNERLTEQTFSLSNYESKIQLGLASEARMVNGMLYRNNVGQEDFEEETYLDMYIYRLGRKLNKIVTGVEDYKESDKLVKEAYRDMYKDKKPRRSYDISGFDYKHKMEDAYRKGDLDLLDSLQDITTVSDAFNEKFLFRRNDIQANSIDTILKKHSLFVGVGAAHLPGERGVIELLRKKGYTVRPVVIGQRNSEEKDKLEKIRVPVEFKRQYAEDSLFSVEIPGEKFFRFGSFAQTNMMQYADMANGSYYMATRVKTNAALLGQSAEEVLRKTDSMLYENVPGKILSKKTITKNGFNGFDITNRTRKGDVQRYNIFILPNELVILKISGIADYISGGKEADQFFSSVIFDSSAYVFKQTIYQPPYGGFTATFPSKPVYVAEKRNDKSRSEWLSVDNNGNDYFIFKTTINQYDYIEEDTFELRLMEESFKSSPVIKESANGKTASWKGYPVINAKYLHADGSQMKIRYLIQGANYYLIGVRYKTNESVADDFLNSFNITATHYGEVKERKDAAVGFSVNSPLFYPPADTTDDFSIQDLYAMSGGDEDKVGPYIDMLKSMFIKTIGNDTTGERITLVSFRFPKYTYLKDSAAFMKSKVFIGSHDKDYIIKTRKESVTPNHWYTIYYQATDTASSRIITAKSFYKDGVIFYLANMSDSVTPPGSFVSNFFETFTPSDTFKAVNVFEKKSKLFFSEYFSSDSALSKKAMQSMAASLFDSSDLSQIKKAISQLSWRNKNYLSLKKRWINVMSNFHDTASVNYLTDLYTQVKDTSGLQNAILNALLEMRTAASFASFKDLLLQETPALITGDNAYDDYQGFNMDMMLDAFTNENTVDKRSAFNGHKWAPLYDTLALSKTIIPDLLQMITLDDYKDDILELLTYAVDSGYIKADDYKQYYTKLLLDAKQRVKKQVAREDEKEMNKLDRDDDADNNYNYNLNNRSVNNYLENYAVLLMPFWDRSAEVPALFEKLLQLRDKDIKISTAVLMLRNKKNVPDSILNMLAADDHYRLSFYNQLNDAGIADKFPVKYKNQTDMALSALSAAFYYSKTDSLIYLDKLQVNDAKHKGWLYFFKYKKSKDDKEWHIAYSGLQPLDATKISTTFNAYKNDFIGYSREVYNTADVKQKMQQLLKENLYALRKSSSQFYGNNNDEDALVVDEVKGGRVE